MYQNGKNKEIKRKIPSADKDTQQLKRSYPAGKYANPYSHSGKQFGSFLSSQTCTCHVTQRSPSSVSTWEIWRLKFIQQLGCRSLQELYLKLSKIENNPNVHQQVSNKKVLEQPYSRIRLISKKEQATDTYSNVDKSNCITRERTPFRKATCCLNSFTWHTGKGKTRSGEQVASGWGGRRVWPLKGNLK